MRVVWSRSARADLRAHILYIAQRNPVAARLVRAAIREAVDRLVDYPHRGRPGRQEGTRELVIGDFPYLVVYSLKDGNIAVARVLHTAQNWPQ
jgi:toxin ParE1/3/4